MDSTQQRVEALHQALNLAQTNQRHLTKPTTHDEIVKAATAFAAFLSGQNQNTSAGPNYG